MHNRRYDNIQMEIQTFSAQCNYMQECAVFTIHADTVEVIAPDEIAHYLQGITKVKSIQKVEFIAGLLF